MASWRQIRRHRCSWIRTWPLWQHLQLALTLTQQMCLARELRWSLIVRLNLAQAPISTIPIQSKDSTIVKHNQPPLL